MHRSVLEISAIKVESCQNRTEFWTFCALPNFVGGIAGKISVYVITMAISHIPC